MVINYASYVIILKPFITYSVNVIMLDFCGVLLRIVFDVSVKNLFDGWHKQGGNKYNSLLQMGAAAFCWSIWLTRNEKVFNNYQPKTYMQVLFKGTHWLHFILTQ